MTQPKISGIVLAGGGRREWGGPDNGLPKALLVTRDGQRLFQVAVDALLGSGGRIGDIHVIGDWIDRPALEANGVKINDVIGDCFIDRSGVCYHQGGTSMVENLMIGLNACQGSKAAVITADLPDVTYRPVRQFLDDCVYHPGLSAGFTIVGRQICEVRYPKMPRTYARLSEGTFTLGNLFWFDRKQIMAQRPLIEMLSGARKNKWQLARMFGLKFLVGLIFGSLQIADLEERLEDIADPNQSVGLYVKAFVCGDPAVAADIDKPEQWQCHVRDSRILNGYV